MKTNQLNFAGLLIAATFMFLLSSCSKDEVTAPSGNAGSQDAPAIRPNTAWLSEASSTIVHLPGLVVDAFGNQPSNPGTILYNPFTGSTIGVINGNMITYGDYLRVNGQADVRCGNNGTQLTLHMHDLFPNATYTVWIETYQSPGYEGSFDNRIGIGAFGKSNGTNNKFKASASGEGQLSVTLPDGALSQFGSVSNCLISDEYEYHIIGVYGSAYGPGHETQ